MRTSTLIPLHNSASDSLVNNTLKAQAQRRLLRRGSSEFTTTPRGWASSPPQEFFYQRRGPLARSVHIPSSTDTYSGNITTVRTPVPSRSFAPIHPLQLPSRTHPIANSRSLAAQNYLSEILQVSHLKEVNATQQSSVKSLRAESAEAKEKYDQLVADSNAQSATLPVQILDPEVSLESPPAMN